MGKGTAFMGVTGVAATATATANGAVAPDAAGGAMLKRDRAYAALYEEIVRLRLAPGALIDEGALGRRLGLGRTPIREALHQLAHDGLVTIYPRRGMVVAPISLLDLREQVEARLMWEPNIARLAATTGTAADWHALAALLAGMPEAVATEEDVARASDINRRFHRGIAAATRNRYLVEVVDRLGRQRERLPFLFFAHGIYQPVTDEHHTILDHLRRGDGEGVARLVERHIARTRARQIHLT